MRQIILDELSPMERDNIDSYLKRMLGKGPMIGLYWLEIPEHLLSETQAEHNQCAPYYAGVEMENNSVRFELLIRNATNLHCSCTHYATPSQRQYILDFIDTMIEDERIQA